MNTESYPLAPIQQGMLFHWLLDRHSGTDIEQIVADLHEPVDPTRFRTAWQDLLDSYSTLRTTFEWEGLATPVQRIEHRAQVELHFEDLRGCSPTDRSLRLDQYLESDRSEGFDLRVAPAMRVALFQTADAQFRMVWTFHHILMDGRSFEILLNRVFDAYDSIDAPAAIDRPYREYIEWVTQNDPSHAREFWRRHLAGFSAPTPLPYESLVPQSRSGQRDTSLSVEATANLRALASRANVSLNIIVMSAWAVLLARYSGESDVVFGATKTTRRSTIPDVGAMVGLFLATIPVRIPVQPDTTVLDFLERTREEWVSLRGSEHLPLVEIAQVSEVESTNPLFSSLVVFENYRFATHLRSQGGQWANRHFDILEQSGLPLTFLAYADDELALRLEFDGRRYHPATIVRLLDGLAHILTSWGEDADKRLSQISILTDHQLEEILVDWNATEADYPRDATLVSLLRAQAERTPSAVAILQGAQHLTYFEVDQRSNVLARFLRSSGVRANSLVGVCIERSIDLVIALVAVLKSGAAYVPLDPDYPEDRLRFMVEDSGVTMVIAQAALSDRLKDAGLGEGAFDGNRREVSGAHPLLCIDSDWEYIVAAADAWEGSLEDPVASDLAYMIYTSGSTGRPKGAKNAHAGIVNRLLWMQGEYALSPSDVILQKTPFSFDVSVWEFFWPMVAGAKLLMAAPGGHRDASYLIDTILSFDITVVHFVPSMLRVFLEHPRVAECDRVLRDVMCSGEALPFALTESFFDRLPNVRLHNLYGPTEAAVDVTYWQCIPGDERRIVPIGRPIANTQMYVLDANIHAVPIGVASDLYIGGVQVGQGYHNRPELTAERFIANPFASRLNRSSGRLYRTGDVARWLPDGSLEYLGRSDYQVKVRGFRIELGEIESLLQQYPSVTDAVVVAGNDIAGDMRLIGYIVADPVSDIAAEDLRSHLKKALPDYMVPAAFISVPSLPLTANGKIDRKALPAPDLSHVIDQREIYVAPRSEFEEQIAEIWAQVLKHDRIGINDNFFDLGGHSLLAMQVIARMRNRLNVDIPLQAFFETATIRTLADAEASKTISNDDELLQLLAEIEGMSESDQEG